MTNIGRQMPCSLEAENAIIGGLLIDSNAFKEIESIIKSDDFYLEKNKLIFSAVERLNAKHSVIDMVTVMQELMSMGKLDDIGGPYELSQATNAVTSSSHIKYHAEIVKEKSTARKLIELSSTIVDKSFEQSDPINETIEYLEKAITEVNTSSSDNACISLAEALKLSTDKAAEIQSMREKGIDISIKTGLTDLNREFNGGFRAPDLIIIGGRPSMGKALRMDAKILTVDGFVLNKDLKIGDKIASIDGKESFVTGIYPQGIVETYEIEFSDGRIIECCKDHLWEVNSSKFKNKTLVLSTLQIKDRLTKKRYKGRMSIPMYCGIFGVKKDFIINPYLIGVLIGDGSLTSGVEWCKPDIYIAEKISKMIDKNHSVKSYSGNRFSIIGTKGKNIYLNELRKLGLYNTHSYERFIPTEYMNSSREQRLELLNGLLDTDGDIDKLGSISFNSTSERLANDVQKLCWSLGYRCSIRRRKSMLNGIRMRDSFRLHISGENQYELFSLPRKKERIKIRKVKPLTIISVKEKSICECQCISVSHDRSLYITDDYIVTHNTQFSLHFAKHAALSNKQVLFISIEMTASQLADRLILEDESISMYNLRTGLLSSDEWKAIDAQAGKLYNLNINIADSHNIRYINNIKSEARRMKRQSKLDILFIDYLGLIKTNMKFGTRDLEIGYITGELKSLAKELNIPIVLLSQLSRPPKGMTVKEPQLEDLRESGNIEQDADVVLFIHRPSYYDPSITNSNGESWENKGKLIIAKYREGARNRDIIFKHDDKFKKIFDDDSSSKYVPSGFKKVAYDDNAMPF